MCNTDVMNITVKDIVCNTDVMNITVKLIVHSRVSKLV